jgi:hypothetical protein
MAKATTMKKADPNADEFAGEHPYWDHEQGPFRPQVPEVHRPMVP